MDVFRTKVVESVAEGKEMVCGLGVGCQIMLGYPVFSFAGSGVLPGHFGAWWESGCGGIGEGGTGLLESLRTGPVFWLVLLCFIFVCLVLGLS